MQAERDRPGRDGMTASESLDNSTTEYVAGAANAHMPPDAPFEVLHELVTAARSRLEPGAWDVPRAVSPRWPRVERELPMLTGGRPDHDLKGEFFRGAETAGEVPAVREFIPPTVPASWWIGVVELRL